jgi:hypothetical protein
MDTPESSHSAEAVQQQPDLLIVLGKNIGVDFNT